MDADRIVAADLVGGDTACLSLDGEAFIKGWEACSLTPYLDGAGRRTVGYGHLLLACDTAAPITQDEADSLFIVDSQYTAEGVSKLIYMPVLQYVFDALCSFAYNLGLGALAGSTLRKRVNGGYMDQAADQFMVWNKVRDPASGLFIESAGLTRRRMAERALFVLGDYSGRP